MNAFALIIESTTHVWAIVFGLIAGVLLGGCALLAACAIWALVDHVSMKRRDKAQRGEIACD